MGLFEDLSQFLETRLEEFLRDHPELELQALEEQLREQEEDTQRLILDLKTQEKQLQNRILETAQDVQRWHVRIQKVEAAGELKLAEAAREREAALLRQGNQLWGQMEGVKARIAQAETLLGQVRSRRQEVQAKAATAQAARASSSAWNRAPGFSNFNVPGADPLEETFRRWETDDELDRLKRDLGRS